MSEFQLRIQAAERGEKTYRGKDCPKHPGALRYTSNSGCVDCIRANTDARYAKLRDLLKKNSAA